MRKHFEWINYYKNNNIMNNMDFYARHRRNVVGSYNTSNYSFNQ